MRSRVLGILLAVALLGAGRLIRREMLLASDGDWREDLWLGALVDIPATARAANRPPKPKLTAPLPINTCGVDSLVLLPGVGPVLAGRLAEARLAGIVFCNADDLRRVKGIGPALSARLDSLVLYANPTAPDSVSRKSR